MSLNSSKNLSVITVEWVLLKLGQVLFIFALYKDFSLSIEVVKLANFIRKCSFEADNKPVL